MRLTRLRQKLADEGLDAILITNPANRRWRVRSFISISHVRVLSAIRCYAQDRSPAPVWPRVRKFLFSFRACRPHLCQGGSVHCLTAMIAPN